MGLRLSWLLIASAVVSAPASARRDISSVLAEKRVSVTYTSSNATEPLTQCLDRALNGVTLPMGLVGSRASFNNVDTVRLGPATHISFSPSWGGDSDRDHQWAFTLSLTPSGDATLVEVRQRGASYRGMGWREKAEACILQPLARLPILSTPAATAAPSSVADELAKFAALRDRGVITEEEFQSQKARLLN